MLHTLLLCYTPPIQHRAALTTTQLCTPPMPAPSDTVARAGGVIEGTLCYTGDVSNPRASKYTLEYYLNLAGWLVKRLLN